ncbi:MAG: 4'-phosphopantetheinyl transferase superfamily protein [Rikenellaceae bacterium]
MSRVEILPIERALEYRELLTPKDEEDIARFSSVRRVQEVSAWRSLLRWTLSDMGLCSEYAVAYDSVGAPCLADCDLFISVSHSRTHVAIAISQTKCAIDIESLDRDFERVATRYASNNERSLLADSMIAPSLHLPLIWSAKEAMYKHSGRVGLDLLNDLVINKVSNTQINNMPWQIHDNHIVVYTC